MNSLSRLIWGNPNGNGVAKKTEPEPEVDLSETRQLRERLRQQASEPLIPEETKRRLSDEMSAGSKEVDKTGEAVQKSLSDLDAELGKRDRVAEEDA
jgi:hypothetical protein